VRRLVPCAALLLLVVGCGGGATATSTPGSTTPGSTQPPSSPGATSGGGAASPGGPAPQYQAGAGTATVVVDSTQHPVSAGTCSLEASDAGGVTASKFTFAAGTAMQPGWLDVEVTSLGSPIVDGQYTTGLSSVSLQIDESGFLLLTDLTITLQNGVTSGSFSGTSAGNSPKPVTGTFTC